MLRAPGSQGIAQPDRLKKTRKRRAPQGPRLLEYNFRRAQVVIAIAAVVMASLFATQISLELLAGIVVLVTGTAVVLAFLRWPPLGLLALIPSAMVIPFAIGTGTESGINIAILLLFLLMGLWLLHSMAYLHSIDILSARYMLPLVGLVLVATIAFVLGQLPWFIYSKGAPLRAQIGGLAIFALSAVAFFLAAHQIRSVRWLKWLTWVYILIGGVYIASRAYGPLGKLIIPIFQVNASSVFWIWLVALVFSQAMYNRKLKLPIRLALFALLAATLYVSFIKTGYWKSGWVPAMAAIVVILWLGSPRLGLAASVIAVGLLVFDFSQAAGVLTGSEEYSLLTRLEAWRILLGIIKINPILGLGPANYYFYTALFPILGYYVQFNSHNNYIDIVAQTGLLGLLFFLWFFYEIGRVGLRLHRTAPEGFPRAYALGALGGLAGMLVSGMLGDWVLPFVYNVGLFGFRGSVLGWLLLGGLAALEQILKAEDAAAAATAASGVTGGGAQPQAGAEPPAGAQPPAGAAWTEV